MTRPAPGKFTQPFAGVRFVAIAAGLMLAGMSVIGQADKTPVATHTVNPNPDGSSVTITSEFDLRGGPSPVLKDFGQLKSVRATVDGNETPLTIERRADVAVLTGLPEKGRARIEAALFCVTDPQPGYRKRLMGWPGGVIAREGLFIRLAGHDQAPIDVRFELPPAWSLGLGREGIQTWADTQKSLWFWGRNLTVRDVSSHGRSFRVVVAEGVDRAKAAGCSAAAEAAFAYAAANFGDLTETSFGVAVFPSEYIRGGTALGPTVATGDDEVTVAHELLHWWTNHRTPAWFREGVHTYMAAKVLALTGRMDESGMADYLELRLSEHRRVVRDEGGSRAVVESSRAYDRGERGGDMYGLAPLAAAALDREIVRHTGEAGLETVFATVCRDRTRLFDTEQILTLIRTKTGYDPGPFFHRFFESPVAEPERLLKAP